MLLSVFGIGEDNFRLDESLVDESNSEGERIHFVFSNTEALARVRFELFVRDCRALERPAAELAEVVNTEKDLLARFREIPKIAMIRTPARTT